MTIITPLPLFLAWSAAIFGVGSMYRWIGQPFYRADYPSIFSTDPSDYVKVSLLSTIGLAITLFSFSQFVKVYLMCIAKESRLSAMISRFLNNLPQISASHSPVKNNYLRSGYILLLLSLLLELLKAFLVVNLFQVALLSSLTTSIPLASILMLSAGSDYKSRGFFVALLLGLILSMKGILVGMRMEAVLPFVVLFIGNYLATKSKRVLVVSAASILTILILITPIVTQVRRDTWPIFQPINNPAKILRSSANIKTKATARLLDNSIYNEYSIPALDLWKRLDYSNWQESMMSQYDKGNEGSTYRYLFWTFVPRFLYPSKPKLLIGSEIGYKIQGVSQASSFSGTVYGEMYWNGGWMCLVLSSIVYGIILSLVSIVCLWLYERSSSFAHAICTYGILLGFTSDTHFSVNVVGQSLIFLALFIILLLASCLWLRIRLMLRSSL